MLCLLHYKKAYGPVTILTIEQLQLDAGNYWLKGANGTGKTTLLKSIAGLIPFEGDILVKGISLRKQRSFYTRIVAFAEAEPVYPPFLTGKELMQVYLQTKGGTNEHLLQLAEALGIAPYLAAKVGTYSSGMLKKLSLLLSFCGEPHLVLLDEPFITLDAKAVDVLRSLIAEYAKQQVSFLISSHQELALSVTYQELLIHQQTIKKEAYAKGAQ